MYDELLHFRFIASGIRRPKEKLQLYSLSSEDLTQLFIESDVLEGGISSLTLNRADPVPNVPLVYQSDISSSLC